MHTNYYYYTFCVGAPGNNGCLQNIACQSPQQAKRYAAAGDMLLKVVRMVTSEEPEQKYQYILQELQEAANIGVKGGDCARYTCGTERKRR